MKSTIDSIAQRNWPLAPTRQGRRQAVSLLRAKRYLTTRGIAAHVVNSKFEYKSAPVVL